MRILVVEDEKRLAQTLVDLLTQNNYLVDVSYDGEHGLDSGLTGIYDAIILDIMLPFLDGFQVIQALRSQQNNTPVLMLTAKSELEDRIKGLDLGSDYYVTKPFEPKELLACLRAIMRRKGEIQPCEITYGDLTLNPETAELFCLERSIRLRAKEMELLRLLMENKDRLLSKETLQTKVWGYDSEVEGNVVEVYLSFLRKKLAHIKSNVKISAVRMVGYRLEVGND